MTIHTEEDLSFCFKAEWPFQKYVEWMNKSMNDLKNSVWEIPRQLFVEFSR